MLTLNNQNECYSFKCQGTTEVQDIKMKQHLKELGYYQLKMQYFKYALMCIQCIAVVDDVTTL